MRTVRDVTPPNIPAAKRAGLPVDLERLAVEGDGWLSPEDRYALKTHGVCSQLQDGVFMIRVRIPGGVALTSQVRGMASIAARRASDWLHLTTRQNVELHWVAATGCSAGSEQPQRLRVVDPVSLRAHRAQRHVLRGRRRRPR